MAHFLFFASSSTRKCFYPWQFSSYKVTANFARTVKWDHKDQCEDLFNFNVLSNVELLVDLHIKPIDRHQHLHYFSSESRTY